MCENLPIFLTTRFGTDCRSAVHRQLADAAVRALGRFEPEGTHQWSELKTPFSSREIGTEVPTSAHSACTPTAADEEME